MDRYGLGWWNAVGQIIVDFFKWMEVAVENTYFKTEHRITCRSGGRSTQSWSCLTVCPISKIGKLRRDRLQVEAIKMYSSEVIKIKKRNI